SGSITYGQVRHTRRHGQGLIDIFSLPRGIANLLKHRDERGVSRQQRVSQPKRCDFTNRFGIIALEVEIRKPCNPGPSPQLWKRAVFGPGCAFPYIEDFRENAGDRSTRNFDLSVLLSAPLAEQHDGPFRKE